MKKIWLICYVALLSTPGLTQDSTTVSTADLLNFWVGEWDLLWKDANGKEASGSNRIVRELDGKIICEYFKANDGAFAGFTGRSWSVYNQATNTWKQTWVDNQGGYLDFTGRIEGDNFVFHRQQAGAEGKVIQQKMVFRDIKANQFTWDWMRSTDNGLSWKLAWQIFYTRRKS